MLIEDSIFYCTETYHRICPDVFPNNHVDRGSVTQPGTSRGPETTAAPAGGSEYETLPKSYFGNYHHSGITIRNSFVWDRRNYSTFTNTQGGQTSNVRSIISMDNVQGPDPDRGLLHLVGLPEAVLVLDEQRSVFPREWSSAATTSTLRNVNTPAMKAAMALAVAD